MLRQYLGLKVLISNTFRKSDDAASDIADIVYRNGKPVYVYKSLEGIPDPMTSLVRIFLDFAEIVLFIFFTSKLSIRFTINFCS